MPSLAAALARAAGLALVCAWQGICLWPARSERRLGCERRAHGACSDSHLQPAGDLRARSGGLSRRSAPSDHLQAAVSLSIHLELCAHSPTGTQSTQARAQARAGQAHARARPQAMPERARGWAMAVGAEQPPSARPSERCEARLQLPEPSTFCRRQTSLIHQKSRFCMLAVRTRRLRHQMLLIALITMMCSGLTNCSAFSHNCKSKSGAPWRQGTG